MNKEIEKNLAIFEDKIPLLFNKKTSIRSSQVQMSLDITEFLYNSSKNILFLEAPVGTGKSLGTLVPSILYSTNQQNSITYATSTINLQNQIFDSDSVTLEKLELIKPNEKILALGKSNYICRAAYLNYRDKFLESEIEQLNNYFDNCLYGYVSELEKMYPGFNRYKIKKYLLMSNLSGKCFGSCPSHEHRYKYKDNRNKLTITNHDQQIQTYLNLKYGYKEIIPSNPGIIVFDEAHSLKENFLGRLEQSLTYSKLKKIKLKRDSTKYNALVNKLKNEKIKYVNSNFESSMRYQVSDDILEIVKSIKSIIESNIAQMIMSKRFSNSSNTHDELEIILNHLIAFIDNEKNTSWLQFDGNIELHYVSNHFNKEFKKFITNVSQFNKIIFMSGTLTSGEHTNEFKINWGLNENQYIYKKYSSAFNLKKQTLVYVPKIFPHPSKDAKNHLAELEDCLPELLNLSSGGALILCTSNEHVATISNNLKKNPINNNMVYTQGESSVSLISDKFKKDESSILVGSGSFFSGFSVEGRSLDKVILTKLPYPVPTDPYINLISSGCDEKDVFNTFIRPMMFKKLEQGLGRLIRSRNDYGILTIFDSRIWGNSDTLHFFEERNYKLTPYLDDIFDFMRESTSNGVQIEHMEYKRSDLNIPSFSLSRATNNFSEESKTNFEKNKLNTLSNSNKDNSDLIGWLRNFVQENKIKNNNPNPRISYSRIKYPKDIYQIAINFCYRKELPLDLVRNSFPYSSDRQRNNFNRIIPTIAASVKIKKSKIIE
ncbi:ATP-dependent DNA helicase [Carnobacterium inhibens]|uniref:ATP-dependent DNA helicase n=1 Tax=Carnobacterium inhibens TaxID=147709 RepID=UPI000552B632|nr:ATP-dependent DNA helicase [Carnobacterium inhibens]